MLAENRMVAKGLFVLMVSAISFGLGSPALAAKGGTNRPFRGEAEGMIVGGSADGTQLEVEYVGKATHLGKFTRTEVVTIGATGNLAGTIVFRAANGDQLFVEFEGQLNQAGDTAIGEYTFTGGTGRFSDASGSADFVATLDGGNVSAVFDGRISY